MADYSNLLGGDSNIKRVISESRDAGHLFQGATWDQVGTDKELTKFLHDSIDPNGSRYGGSTDALKEDLLNTQTARGNSALASIWDAVGARTEGVQRKQFENLVGRLYEQAPNRLTSGDASQAMSAVGAGLKGAVLYDLPLNLAFGAGALSKLGVGLGAGKAAIMATGRAGIGEAVAKAAGTEAGSAAARLAAEEAALVAKNQIGSLTWQGAKQGAKTEAVGGAVGGGLGDIAQQDAGVSRGLQDEISVTSALANTAGGAVLGGVFGGVGGAFEGRSVGREIANGIDGSIDAGRKALADAAPITPPGSESVPIDFLSPADQYVESKAMMQDAYGEVGVLANRVRMGDATSNYSPDQLRVLETVLAEFESAGNKAEFHTQRANDLIERGNKTGDAKLLAEAAADNVKAKQYQSFVTGLLKISELGDNGISGASDDMVRKLVSLVGPYDERVAAAFGPAPAPKGKAKVSTETLATQSSSAPPSSAAAGSSGEPPTQAGQGAAQVVQETAQADLKQAVPVADAGNPTAADITKMAETVFTPDEKVALTTLQDAMTKAGIDLQTALDSMASTGENGGQAATAARIATAAGADRGAVKEALAKVTAAAQREQAKVAPAPSTASVDAPAAGAMDATEQAVQEVQAIQADNDTMIDALMGVAGGDTELAKLSAVQMHNDMVTGINQSISEVNAVLDGVVSKIDEEVKTLAREFGESAEKLSKADKVDIVRRAIAQAKESNPDLAPLLAEIDPAKLVSKKGVESAKIKMQTMADDAVAFTYAKVVGDVLPDATNVDDFGKVLRGMLQGVPADDVNKIVSRYRTMVYEALVDRINAIGIDSVKADPKLGPAWQRLIAGNGGWESFGGKSKVTVDVGKIIQENTDHYKRAIEGTANLAEAEKALKEAGGVVRNFMKQLQIAGIPMDSDFMRRALEMRALHAVHDAVEGTFRKENAEAFKKIEAMRSLRAADKQETVQERTPNNYKNPFFEVFDGSPILHRVAKTDAEGNATYVDLVVSGRSLTTDKNGNKIIGKPQGVFSDGISDYLGLLWNSPKKIFASVGAARRAILGASVEAASDSLGTMVINGVKMSGSMKKLKGLYKETAIAQAEQNRFGLILDAAERRRLPETDKRYLSADAYKAHVEKIGSFERKVTMDEQYVAEMMIDHKDRVANNNTAAQAEMADILSESADLGESSAAQINAVVSKLNAFKARNDNNLLNVLLDFQSKAEGQIKGRSRAGEGAEAGSTATGTTRDRVRNDAGAKEKAASPERLSVTADGVVTPGKRDSDPVVVTAGDVKYEIVPKDHINLTKDGYVEFFGVRVGKWSLMDSHSRTMVDVDLDGMGRSTISDLTGIANRKKFIRQNAAILEANQAKLAKVSESAQALPEGAQIDHTLSQTAKVAEAKKELMTPSVLKESDLDSTIGSFEVKEGHRLAFRLKDGDPTDPKTVQIPGPLQGGMTVRAFLTRLNKNFSPDDFVIGTRSVDKKNKTFDPLGRDLGTVDNALIKRLADKKENAVPMLKAQRRSISMNEAAKIEVSNGRTLADLVTDFDASSVSMKWSQIPDLDTLEVMISSMEKQAAIIQSLAPHGIKRSNASRRTSFYHLQQHMAQFSTEEMTSAMDMMRRLEADQGGLPYFRTGDENGFSMKADGTSSIVIGKNADAATPKHFAVAHELGHWAFANMLSPEEKIQFFRSLRKYYDADGKFDPSMMDSMLSGARAIEKAVGQKFKGLDTSTNELFAWQFTNHAFETTVGKGGAAAEATVWKRAVAYVKNLLGYFTEKKYDAELVPLFERILPSNPSESKFDYNRILGIDGKPLDLAAIPDQTKRQALGSITSLMRSIDEKRSRIGQVLFTTGGIDSGASGELREATKFMFGLLNGRDSSMTVGGLRQKLNPTRQTGEIVRGKNGKPVRDANGKAVKESEFLKGSIDPRDLFSRSGTGKLMDAINAAMPENSDVASNVAFEAAAGAENFALTLKATSRKDMPDVEFAYNQALEQEFNRKVASGMKPEDALNAADDFATKQAAEYAQETYNIDITESLFDEAGARVVLGSEAERAALEGVARKLHDMMGDALDHLEGEATKRGALIQRTTREIATVEPTAAEKLVDAKVAAKVKKVKTPKQKQAPTTKRSAEVVAREESERVDGVLTGVPSSAPELVKAIIARVPHRDEVQSDIIGAVMYRTFSHFFGDKMDEITNADISRMTGIALEDGYQPNSMASSGTAAFDSLRKTFRAVSEVLTNGNKKAGDAEDLLVDMFARMRKDDLNEQFPSSDIDINGMSPKLSSGSIAKAVKAILKKQDVSGSQFNEMMIPLMEMAADAREVVAGLGGTAESKRLYGESVATPGAPSTVKLANGTYHPVFAKASVQSRLASLPQKIVDDLKRRIGATDVGDSLADFIGFVGQNRRKVFTTADQMIADLVESDVRISNIDAEIAAAITKRDKATEVRLIAKRDALMEEIGASSDGVSPVMFDRHAIYDPVNATEAEKHLFEKAMKSGKHKDESAALKDLGYLGLQDGNTINVFSASTARDMEREIAHVASLVRNADAGDTPLTGEIFLNLALADGVAPNPMAVEQRALQAGAPGPMARLFSNLFKGGKSAADGIGDDGMAKVRSFHGVQLSSNADRIMKMGGKWLANLIAPKEGTGFFDSLTTKTMSDLAPRIAALDKLTGVDSWWKKTGYEIYRNLDMRGHSMPQSPPEMAIAMALRSGDDAKLTMDERKVMVSINKLFRDLLVMQNEAGIPVADVTNGANNFYLPQRFNLDWIRANKEEAVTLLGGWFKKDREAAGRSSADAMVDARRVVHDAINKEELQGMIDGANSTYAQAFGDKLHKRQLNIVGKDWEKMAPLFDNNLRSLVASYTEVAHKRVEWSKRFGVRGHGVNTYADVASRGSSAAIDALMSKAGGIKYVSSALSAGEDLAQTEVRDVEFMSNLFTAFTKNESDAARMVALIQSELQKPNGRDGVKGLADLLVERYEMNGGAGVDHFRVRAEAIVNGLADFGDAGKSTASHEIDFMLKTVGVLGGRPSFTISSNQGVRSAAQAVKLFNSVTLLSGATLGSLGDSIMPLLRSGSLSSTMKGTLKAVRLAMGDPATAEAMMRVAVNGESILSENIGHANGGAMGRISNAFFQGTLLTPWTNSMRQYAALVGFESIKANQVIVQREAMAGNAGNWKHRKSMKYLRELGLGYLAEGKKLDVFSDAVNGDMKIAEAIHKFTNESVFQPNRNDMPLWTQDPIASMFWQFKSYPTMMGRLVKKNFKDAISYEGGSALDKLAGKEVGKYNGDPMGLMYLMTAGAAMGSGAVALKETIRGSNQDAEDGNWHSPRKQKLSEMGQQLGFKDFNIDEPGADLIMGSYANGLLSLGALGFLGDLMYQSAKSIDNGAFGRERIMSQIAGPALGTFMDTIQLVDGARSAMADGVGEGDADQRNAVRKVLKRIPFAGLNNVMVESAVNEFAGDSTTKPVNAPAFGWTSW